MKRIAFLMIAQGSLQRGKYNLQQQRSALKLSKLLILYIYPVTH